MRKFRGIPWCWTRKGNCWPGTSRDKNLGYDHVVRLGWDFIEHKVPQ